MTLPALCVLLAAFLPGDGIRPKETWGGVLQDASLREVAPESGIVTDAQTFNAIWKAWRPNEDMPEIDFAKSFVLVGTIDGPNRMFANLRRDGEGNVATQFGGTLIGGPGFGYLIVLLPREGIRSVNGRPIGATEPENAPEEPRPERSREFVRVAVCGTLETGIVAIGGETTGTVVRANGMTFELVLDEPNLRERADGLNGRPVVVAGELTIRSGVETGPRLLIDVKRIDPAPDRRPNRRRGGTP